MPDTLPIIRPPVEIVDRHPDGVLIPAMVPAGWLPAINARRREAAAQVERQRDQDRPRVVRERLELLAHTGACTTRQSPPGFFRRLLSAALNRS